MSCYPEKFPYTISKSPTSLGHRKKCDHCRQGIEFPHAFIATIDSSHRYFICHTKSVRTMAILCSKKCAAEYWWMEFCIRRLNGNFK